MEDKPTSSNTNKDNYCSYCKLEKPTQKEWIAILNKTEKVEETAIIFEQSADIPESNNYLHIQRIILLKVVVKIYFSWT